MANLGDTVLALPHISHEVGKVISIAIKASDIILAAGEAPEDKRAEYLGSSCGKRPLHGLQRPGPRPS